MKIGIFGEHPALNAGFSSAMALTQAHAFSQLGHQVTMYLPALKDDPFPALLLKKGFLSLEDLPRYGLDIEIKTVRNCDGYQSDLDMLIWQSYSPEYNVLMPKRRNFLLTKNFPRFAASTSDRYRRKASGALKIFDLLAFSLKADVAIVEEMEPDQRHRFGHVPRGFVPDWLPHDHKGARPRICGDAAVKAADGGAKAVEHMARLVKHLRARGDDIEVSATRSAAHLIGADVTIQAMPLLDFYAQFIAPAWIYMPCDFEHSVHSKNADRDANGKTVHIGLYENQIVEMQMAGAIPVFRRGDLDPEIIFDLDTCSMASYSCLDELVAKYDFIVENFSQLSQRARAFALKNHAATAMAESWLSLASAQGRRSDAGAAPAG